MIIDNASNMVKPFALPGMEILQLEEDSEKHDDEGVSSYDAAEKTMHCLCRSLVRRPLWGPTG